MRLTNSPQERLKEVTLGLASDATLPNVLLGAWITASIQYFVGMVPFSFATTTGVLWVLSVLLYAVVDEITARIEEQKKELLSNDSDYWGIE